MKLESLLHENMANAGVTEDVQACIMGGLTLPSGSPHGWAYIAGPMRGYEQYNFPAFDAARDYWVARGHGVISPADIDRAAGGGEQRDGYSDGQDADQRAFVLRDFHAIYLLSSFPTSKLVMLPQWERSVGASAERSLASWLGLKIVSHRGSTCRPLA